MNQQERERYEKIARIAHGNRAAMDATAEALIRLGCERSEAIEITVNEYSRSV